MPTLTNDRERMKTKVKHRYRSPLWSGFPTGQMHFLKRPFSTLRQLGFKVIAKYS